MLSPELPSALPQPTEEIIVSNLPEDVNEIQIKVPITVTPLLTGITTVFRNYSILLWGPSVKLRFITIALADRRVSPPCISREKEIVVKPTRCTITGSSMGVSIACFHLFGLFL